MGNHHGYEFDVLIAGGGPAGMAAADAAAESQRVAIVDENPALGGQIWRKALHEHDAPEGGDWRRKIEQKPIARMHGLRIFDAPEAGMLHAEGPEGLYALRYRKLILATGARERFLPFPGWTLRNAMGAGGLQAMVKAGMPIAGKRVVVAGSGPLLLAVAAYLQSHKAEVVAICEQALLTRLATFAAALLAEPAKLAQAARYRWQLRSVPYRIGWWPIAAHGREQQLGSVVVSNGVHQEEILCDFLACGFYLVPNVELASLLGCALRHGAVDVNPLQETTVPSVYCAGEATGIGGLDKSLVEGAIAGYAATGQLTQAHALTAKRDRAMRFADAMNTAFALRPELRQMPEHDTLVCRCEDVAYKRLQPHPSWRAAKLHTRCGMGACQGRICGAAMNFLSGWTADSVRPPLSPVRFETLAAANSIPSHNPSNE